LIQLHQLKGTYSPQKPEMVILEGIKGVELYCTSTGPEGIFCILKEIK